MFEWQTGEGGWDKAANAGESPRAETAQPLATEERTRRRVRRRRLLIGLSLVVVLVVGVFAGLKWQANRNLTLVRTAVQATLDREMWALESGNWDLYESLLDARMPARWYQEQQLDFVQYAQRGESLAEVTDLVLVQPDLAIAEVRIDFPNGAQRREARAYRQAGNAWQRTLAPAGNLWSNQVMRETANLRFIYHLDDAARLEPLLPALQDLYARLLADFHLSPLSDRRELQIVLSVQPADVLVTEPNLRYDLSTTAATSDTDQLQRELGRQLTDRVIRQFYDRAGDMAFVLDGIREWEVSQWMQARDPQSETLISQTLDDRAVLPLSTVQPRRPPAYLDTPAAAAFTETIVDYLVHRYGRQVIGQLVRGLEKYDNWPHLIERGLEIPFQDVDLGWWQSVAEQYALPRSCYPDQLYADLTWMLELERYAFETGNQQVFQSLLDPQASSEWRARQLGRLVRRSTGDIVDTSSWPGDLLEWGCKEQGAWATVTLQEDSDTGQYLRGMRFFRSADQRWYLTSHAIAFPGRPITLSTRRWVFHYREPDADLLPSITLQLDALYDQVIQDLGIDIQRYRPTVTLVYALDQGPVFLAERPDNIRIASPRLFKDIDIFRFMLGFVTTKSLLADFYNTQDLGQGEGLLSDPLSIGLAIWEAEQWGEFPFWHGQKQEDIQMSLRVGAFPSLADDQGLVAGVTIFEYVAATYGRQHLPDLIQAGGTYQALQEVIPTLLGVDVETFEAGWRSYLEQKYGGSKP